MAAVRLTSCSGVEEQLDEHAIDRVDVAVAGGTHEAAVGVLVAA
jgi:hypothetical protein